MQGLFVNNSVARLVFMVALPIIHLPAQGSPAK
nr:MAG TPA: hypothetical protein [Caudoviricetes sp.]